MIAVMENSIEPVHHVSQSVSRAISNSKIFYAHNGINQEMSHWSSYRSKVFDTEEEGIEPI